MNHIENKTRALRNRTLTLSESEAKQLSGRLLRLSTPVTAAEIERKTICQDLFEAADFLPRSFVDLLFLDPPYNLSKTFNSTSFHASSTAAYRDWFESWLSKLVPALKPTASVYICGDWRSSAA